MLAGAVAGVLDSLVKGGHQRIGVGNAGQVHRNFHYVVAVGIGETRAGEIEICGVVRDGGQIGGVCDDVLHARGAARADVGVGIACGANAVQPQAFCVHGRLAQIDCNGPVGRGADAVGGFAAPDEHVQRGGERPALVQADRLRLAIDFSEHALELRIQHGAVASERARGRLRSQRSGAIQKLGNIADAAVSDLQLTQSVVGVADALRQHRFVRTKRVGDGQARRIITGCNDA